MERSRSPVRQPFRSGATSSRVPWYKSTFPTYAGIFLWVGFYLKIAEPTIGYADISVCLWGLLVAGLLCFGLYYYVPAMLGMQTGHPFTLLAPLPSEQPVDT